MDPPTSLKLPAQSQPVIRDNRAGQGYVNGVGVAAALSVCDGLTGLAQQMCYGVVYGVNV
jgi:hypothetical protein